MTRALLRRWPSMIVLPACLDLTTRRIRIVPYLSRASADKLQSIGNYSVIRGVLFALYRIGDDLILRVRDTELRVTDETHATLIPIGRPARWLPAILRRQRAVFTLSHGDATIIRLNYRRPAAETLFPAMYYDEQDEDFLLFLSNVLGDPGQHERVYRTRVA